MCNFTIRPFSCALFKLNGEVKVIRRGMTSNSTAEAVLEAAPYLTQAGNHYGQATRNPGRARKQSSGSGSSTAKGKKKAGKKKREKTARAEAGDAEPRLDLDTPVPRTRRVTRNARAAASGISPRTSVWREGTNTGYGVFGEGQPIAVAPN